MPKNGDTEALLVWINVPLAMAMMGRLGAILTYLPHSRMSLDEPRSTASRFPKELRAIRKFNPLTALLDPNTASKKRLAAI
jgi:hypothetical protein